MCGIGRIPTIYMDFVRKDGYLAMARDKIRFVTRVLVRFHVVDSAALFRVQFPFVCFSVLRRRAAQIWLLNRTQIAVSTVYFTIIFLDAGFYVSSFRPFFWCTHGEHLSLLL